MSAADIDGWRAPELLAPLFMGDDDELQGLIKEHMILLARRIAQHMSSTVPSLHTNRFVIGPAAINNNNKISPESLLAAPQVSWQPAKSSRSSRQLLGRRRRGGGVGGGVIRNVINDTIEGPRAPAVKPGRITQA